MGFWALRRLCSAATGGGGDDDVTTTTGGIPPARAGEFTLVMLTAAFMDMIDGPLARLLHQTSQFGVYVDIVADNVWRTAGWMAAVMAAPHLASVGLLVVVVEWLTFFASQVSEEWWSWLPCSLRAR